MKRSNKLEPAVAAQIIMTNYRAIKDSEFINGQQYTERKIRHDNAGVVNISKPSKSKN